MKAVRLVVLAASLALTLTAGVALAQSQALRPANEAPQASDRAFDPRTQEVPFRTAVQRPVLRDIGPVPITSGLGTNVPVMTLVTPALRLNDTQRWVIDLTAANNSSLTISPEIKCTFMNGEKPVETISVYLSGLPAGHKVAFNVYGPAGEIFVDRAPCVAIGPLN